MKIKNILRRFRSAKYWEKRYSRGGNSGSGSYDHLAEFKANIINAFVKEKNITRVIELGCGDGNQLGYFHFIEYLGLDISQTAVDLCKQKYRDDNTKSFQLYTGKIAKQAELVLSLDVIFHLVEEDVYINYMHSLFTAAQRYVIIYASNSDDQRYNAQHFYQRQFAPWVESHFPNFLLKKVIKNDYPYNPAQENSGSLSNFYIYEKVD
jgi:SAM-dependent methyltransferase